MNFFRKNPNLKCRKNNIVREGEKWGGGGGGLNFF